MANKDCNCCGTFRKHPKANWVGCLNFNPPSCPVVKIPKGVLAPSNAHHSKIMRNSRQLNAFSGNRWKSVNWKNFQSQRQKQNNNIK